MANPMTDQHPPDRHWATFRFYEELNDFLPRHRHKSAFDYPFKGTPAVKDIIQAIGVPHSEVDLILVDDRSVDFSHQLKGGERVAVYPVFERLDIGPVNRLRPRPLRDPRFVLDVHLGTLARYLRLLGFDCRYRNDYDDPTIVAIAVAERRIILTRDIGILKHSAVTHGHWLRATQPRQQLFEVVRAFDLKDRFAPFSRCLVCNGLLEAVAKEQVQERLPPRVRRSFETFLRCRDCDKLYWTGSHYHRLRELVAALEAPL